MPAQVKLIYANKSEEDIICRDILDGFAKQHSNFNVHYVVDTASSKDWRGGGARMTFMLGNLLHQPVHMSSEQPRVSFCMYDVM